MTLREAMEKGVRFVRGRSWRTGNYLEMPAMRDGYHGPWAKLGIHNPDGVIAPDTEVPILFTGIDLDKDDYEPITPLPRRPGEIAAQSDVPPG